MFYLVSGSATCKVLSVKKSLGRTVGCITCSAGYLQEKESSIPHEELGRSIATVQVLQRKHEAFERELTALGNKVNHNY